MPSIAAADSYLTFDKADLLRVAALSTPTIKKSAKAQVYYHASLAICVAAWDAYLKALVEEFYNITSDPLNQRFHAMASLSKQFAEGAKRRFNTPNFENSRTFLVNCTGHDPYNDWTWPRRRFGVFQVRERLNQILHVRHSFAHGFAVPAFTWTQSRGGKVRLTNEGVCDASALLRHLVERTDEGLRSNITVNYGINSPW